MATITKFKPWSGSLGTDKVLLGRQAVQISRHAPLLPRRCNDAPVCSVQQRLQKLLDEQQHDRNAALDAKACYEATLQQTRIKLWDAEEMYYKEAHAHNTTKMALSMARSQLGITQSALEDGRDIIATLTERLAVVEREREAALAAVSNLTQQLQLMPDSSSSKRL